MRILVINNGSSSIKCSLFSFSQYPKEWMEPVWQKNIEWKNIRQEGLEKQLRFSLDHLSVDCVGHRVVHGGKKYKESVKIDASVKQEIRNLSDLAPLHNRADLEGIEVLEKLFPNVPQIAVFDTAFHHTLSPAAAIYPGPYSWVEMGIQRYGFHGTSFQYCAQRVASMLEKEPEKMVICHLGSGASLCAIRRGKSVDTTMGFTPLEGLMMDTRSGSVDPGILLYLLHKKKRTPEELSKELNEQSGLLGLSGISSDMRDILEHAEKGSARAQLALEVYLHRLLSLIGSMVCTLGGIDTLVFTAGIGENAGLIRKRVCDHLSFLGVQIKDNDDEKEDRLVSISASRVQVLVIHTQEAFEIARECWRRTQ